MTEETVDAVSQEIGALHAQMGDRTSAYWRDGGVSQARYRELVTARETRGAAPAAIVPHSGEQSGTAAGINFPSDFPADVASEWNAAPDARARVDNLLTVADAITALAPTLLDDIAQGWPPAVVAAMTRIAGLPAPSVSKLATPAAVAAFDAEFPGLLSAWGGAKHGKAAQAVARFAARMSAITRGLDASGRAAFRERLDALDDQDATALARGLAGGGR